MDESLAISIDLGLRPLMERVLSRRESLKAWDVSLILIRRIHIWTNRTAQAFAAIYTDLVATRAAGSCFTYTSNLRARPNARFSG